jgi:pre-mRNA-splicing factor 38B
MSLMLEHVDSPYIRCIGFLYLRYAAEPSTLWSWYEQYLYDEEPVQIRQGKADTTVGEYIRSLLEDLEYYGTRLPRLPLTLERQFKVKLLQAERVEERAKQHEKNTAAMEYFQKLGSRLQALYGDEENPVTWYDAVVDRVILRDAESGELLKRPKFQVTFPEYGNTEIVTLGEVDLPGSHTAGSAPASGSDVRSPVRRGDERDRGRGYRYDERDRGRGRYSDDRRRGSRDFDRCDIRSDERDYPDSRRLERSRSRDREGFSPSNDVRTKVREAEERELMEEVLRREREKSAAKGKSYASRPTSFKDSLGDRVESRHKVDAEWKPPPKPRADVQDSKPAAAPVVKKTAAELAAIEDKKRRLLAKYG